MGGVRMSKDEAGEDRALRSSSVLHTVHIAAICMCRYTHSACPCSHQGSADRETCTQSTLKEESVILELGFHLRTRILDSVLGQTQTIWT